MAAALEAQVAALAGALREYIAVRSDHELSDHLFYCQSCGWQGNDKSLLHHADDCAAMALLTADATHLAALDAARREVCAAERFVESTYSGTPTGNEARKRLGAALDALAKLEGK